MESDYEGNFEFEGDSDTEDIQEEASEDLDPIDREQLLSENEYAFATMLLMENEPCPEFEWEEEVDSVRYNSPFTPKGNPGPTMSQAPGKEAISYFALFLQDEFLLKIVNWTNLNATTKITIDPSKNKGKWDELSLNELKAFIGLSIVIDNYYKDRIESLWSHNSQYFLTNVPGISEVMTRDRYYQISRYLHFCNESESVIDRNSADYDRLYKVRNLLEEIRQKFQECYIPDQELSVDECMVPFRGRLGFKQYIKDKPIKWGIKVVMLAEAKTGYNFNFDVYTGKDSCGGQVVEMGLGQRIVLFLTKPLHELGYHIYFDRFFTSPELLYRLQQLNLGACGTAVHTRKGFPKCLIRQRQELNQGDYTYVICKNTGITATVWCDKKPIYLLSSIHAPEREGLTIKRNDGHGNKVDVDAVPCVVEYNSFMGGVDLNDKMTTISKSRKSYTWYMRLFKKSVMWCVYNAYIIEGNFVNHSPEGKRKRDFRSFLLDVAHQLVGESRRSSSRHTRVSGLAVPNRLLGSDHFPVVGEGRDHVCVVCMTRYQKALKQNPNIHYSELPDVCKKKKTVFKCNSKNCQVYLCIKQESDCWKNWHTLSEYWR